MPSLRVLAGLHPAHTRGLPAWISDRRVLVGQIGRNLSPSALIAAMLVSGEGWEADIFFCEDVMFRRA